MATPDEFGGSTVDELPDPTLEATETPEPETPEPPDDAPPPDDAEPADEPEPAEPETPAEDATSRQILDWVSQQAPQYRGIADRYKSDSDLIIGLFNTAQKVGERDEYAELGKLVSTRRDDVLRFLQDGGQPQPAPAPTTHEEATYEQIAEWRAAVRANPEHPPREAVEGLARATDQMQRFVLDLKHDPGKVLGPILGQYSQYMQQQLQQTTAQQQAAIADLTALERLAAQHKDTLFRDGDLAKGFTPLGARVDQYFREERAAGAPNSLAFQRAKWRVDSEQLAAAQQQHKPKATRPSAGRKPNVAVPAGGKTGKDEWKQIQKESLGQTLIRKMKEMDAGGLEL